jgi:2-dehydro-3-deoxy-D-gluconate 5-dehydrogenase
MCDETRLPLAGKAAVVTGASRGIGRAIALRLARDGADIGLLQRSDATDVAREISDLGRRAHVVRVDLEQPEAGERAVVAAADALGRLDIAIVNAGRIVRRPALELPLDEWERTLAVNLTSAFTVSRAAARRFFAQGGGGAIVHVASVLSFQGGLNVAAYAASKGGVAQLTRALANEWARFGIRVNAVAPGYVANDQTAPLREDETRHRQITEAHPGRYVGLGRRHRSGGRLPRLPGRRLCARPRAGRRRRLACSLSGSPWAESRPQQRRSSLAPTAYALGL